MPRAPFSSKSIGEQEPMKSESHQVLNIKEKDKHLQLYSHESTVGEQSPQRYRPKGSNSVIWLLF